MHLFVYHFFVRHKEYIFFNKALYLVIVKGQVYM